MKVAKERKMFRNISKFIRTFNPKARLLIQEDEFCFEPETQTIVIDLNEIFFVPIDEAIDKRVLKENGFLFDISIPTFYILHEIAHSLLNHKDLEDYILKSSALSLIEDTYEKTKLYKNIKEEKEADQLAYNLYLHNYNFVKEFDKQILDLLN